MGQLASRVEMGGVGDVDAFVSAAVARLGLRLSAHEREELEAEGFLIMCELHRRFTPAHAQRWCFATYAGEYLPRRLIDSWHRLHRGEHVRRDSGTAGGRRWDYRVIASLEEERARPGFTEGRMRAVGSFEQAA